MKGRLKTAHNSGLLQYRPKNRFSAFYFLFCFKIRANLMAFQMPVLTASRKTLPAISHRTVMNLKMDKEKPKLFRKVNTKAKGVHHGFGGDFKDTRNSKRESLQQVKGTMFGTKQRGLDYTPLFKFLLSKVGCNWNVVFSEAKSRLDKQDPIFWIVALHEDEKKDYVRVGESTYFSGLFVDENGILQLVNPNLKAADMKPFCDCCTHTFNGKVFGTE